MDTTERFHETGARYLKAMFDFSPNRGSQAGLHEYDARQPDLSGEAIDAWRRQLQLFRQELDELPLAELATDEVFDYRLLHSAIDGEIYEWEDEREYRDNPMWYSGALDITTFLTRNYAPLEERVRAAIGYLQNTPRVLQAARENLVPNIPRPFITVSLEVYEGLLSFYDQDLQVTAAQISDEALKAEFERARQAARYAVSNFIGDLKEQYLPRAREEFAIGAKNFWRMLSSGELVDRPVETLLAVGERDLDRNLTAARDVARRIAPDLTPAEASHLLKQERPRADNLIPDTRALLEQIRQFLIDREVVSVPSEVRARVEPTPGFMRWAFAMMDTPGPFEKTATEAYYYVTPPDPNWSPEQQAEWLSSFNPYELQDISVHEAYPGHYVHFLHVNRIARSDLRKLLYSYAFTEGWAHYAEEMMIDVGYGDHNPKLRFAQIAEALIRDCRYLCSLKMHTQGMTVEEATRFFMENAFMEETPARQEALRGTFDPGYLNYTLGKLMIQKLRKDVEVFRGTRFNLKEFHDELLSYGAPPVPLVREAMLGQGELAIL